MVDAGDSRGVVMSRRRGTATIQLAMGLKRFGTRRRLLIAAMVLVPIFAIIAFTPAQAQLNENCVISILNRTAQVQPDGSWRIDNVPANFGALRARANCVEGGATLTGESSLITVQGGISNGFDAEIVLGAVDPTPATLAVTAPISTLTSAGATAFLELALPQ